MKIKIKREEKEFTPIELSITLETKQEEIFWLTILNSPSGVWEKVYRDIEDSFPYVNPLNKEELFKEAISFQKIFYDLVDKTMEDTSND